MTRDQIIASLVALEHTLSARSEIWRPILDAKGNVIKKLYRGSYHNVRRNPEPPQEKQK